MGRLTLADFEKLGIDDVIIEFLMALFRSSRHFAEWPQEKDIDFPPLNGSTSDKDPKSRVVSTHRVKNAQGRQISPNFGIKRDSACTIKPCKGELEHD